MTKTTWFTLWGGLFILCAGLGFIPEPTGIAKFLLTLLSIGFFLPPAVLLYRAKQSGDTLTIRLIRNLALLSLGLTLVALVANFLVLMAPEFVGNLLYAVLIVVSAPMVCSQYWVLSLFCWACLLMASLPTRKRRK